MCVPVLSVPLSVRTSRSRRYERNELCIGKFLFVSCEIYEARVKAAETAREGEEKEGKKEMCRSFVRSRLKVDEYRRRRRRIYAFNVCATITLCLPAAALRQAVHE